MECDVHDLEVIGQGQTNPPGEVFDVYRCVNCKKTFRENPQKEKPKEKIYAHDHKCERCGSEVYEEYGDYNALCRTCRSNDIMRDVGREKIEARKYRKSEPHNVCVICGDEAVDGANKCEKHLLE